MHAPKGVAPKSPPGAPRQQRRACPLPPLQRAGAAPHLQACLQPSSRLGSDSSLQVAWPSLQLPSWMLYCTSEDESAPTATPGPWVPAWGVGRRRAKEVTKASSRRLATATAASPVRAAPLPPLTRGFLPAASPDTLLPGSAAGVGTAPGPAPRQRPRCPAPRRGRAGRRARARASARVRDGRGWTGSLALLLVAIGKYANACPLFHVKPQLHLISLC